MNVSNTKSSLNVTTLVNTEVLKTNNWFSGHKNHCWGCSFVWRQIKKGSFVLNFDAPLMIKCQSGHNQQDFD